MRRLVAVPLVVLTGCSTAPLADALDFFNPVHVDPIPTATAVVLPAAPVTPEPAATAVTSPPMVPGETPGAPIPSWPDMK